MILMPREKQKDLKKANYFEIGNITCTLTAFELSNFVLGAPRYTINGISASIMLSYTSVI